MRVTVEDVCLQAADLLVEWGWQQGATMDRGTGAMCAVGALERAAGLVQDIWSDWSHCWCPVQTYSTEASELFAGAIAQLLGVIKAERRSSFNPAIGNVVRWNDAAGRRQTEVVRALRKAGGV